MTALLELLREEKDSQSPDSQVPQTVISRILAASVSLSGDVVRRTTVSLAAFDGARLSILAALLGERSKLAGPCAHVSVVYVGKSQSCMVSQVQIPDARCSP